MKNLNSCSNNALVEDFMRKKVLEGYGVEDFFYIKNNRVIDKFIFDSGHKIERYSKNYQQHKRNLRMDKLAFIKYFDVSKLKNLGACSNQWEPPRREGGLIAKLSGAAPSH